MTMNNEKCKIPYGIGATDIGIDLHHLFRFDLRHGFHDGSADRPLTARSVRTLRDISCDTDSKHDDVLLHRYRKTGEGSGGGIASGKRSGPAYESFQSEGFSARAVGDAFHDGDNDHWRRSAHARILDAADPPRRIGGSLALFQSCGVLERRKVHD